MNSEFQKIVRESDQDHFFLDFDGTEYLGIGVKIKLEVQNLNDFNKIDDFINSNKGQFIFCLLSYDLKNILFDLKSENSSIDEFPLALFVVAEKLYKTKSDNASTSSLNQEVKFDFPDQENYLNQLEKIKEHIKYGDFYEVNYCINPSVHKQIDPLQTYINLQQLNNAPFSGNYRYQSQHLLCGSPERFLKQTGQRLLSQPIKGTIKRGQNTEEDEQLKIQLQNDPKETAENIMIVDLVRNDLSKIGLPNTLKVEALNDVQTFNTVHQLVSSISCEIDSKTTFSEIIRATFPMGSMTGAPKRRSMELMEKYEDFRRGIYSGSIGFIDEKGDFDLNVVIRSVIYNDELKIVNCPVGGAITYKSDPLSEYDECKLKASSMLKCVLNGK